MHVFIIAPSGSNQTFLLCLVLSGLCLQLRQMKLKDERIKLMNEVLNGIKVNTEEISQIYTVLYQPSRVHAMLHNESDYSYIPGTHIVHCCIIVAFHIQCYF